MNRGTPPARARFTLIEWLVARPGAVPTGTKPRATRFTLIELLVVMAIIAVLLTLTLPAFQRAKSLAQERVCASNMRQIHLALSVYAGNNNNVFPREPTEHNPHPDLLAALDNPSLRPAFYCPQAELVEPYAQITTNYQPVGDRDSIIDTDENWAAGRVSYVYFSFLANKKFGAQAWREPPFKPRGLKTDGIYGEAAGTLAAAPSARWFLADFWRKGAPLAHYRFAGLKGTGLNVLLLDGHSELPRGRPQDNYR